MATQRAVVGEHPDQRAPQPRKLSRPQQLAASEPPLGQGGCVLCQKSCGLGDVVRAPGCFGCDAWCIDGTQMAANELLEDAVKEGPLLAGVDGVVTAAVLQIADAENRAVQVAGRTGRPGLQRARRQVLVHLRPKRLGQCAGAARPSVEVATRARTSGVQTTRQPRVGEGEVVHVSVKGQRHAELVHGGEGAGVPKRCVEGGVGDEPGCMEVAFVDLCCADGHGGQPLSLLEKPGGGELSALRAGVCSWVGQVNGLG